jgi:hypothetical protein
MSGTQTNKNAPLTDAEKEFIVDLLDKVQVKPVDETSIEVCRRVRAILAKLSNE